MSFPNYTPPLQGKSLSERLLEIVQHHFSSVIAGNLTLFTFFFFIIIEFPQAFQGIPGFSQRWYGLTLLFLYVGVTYFLCFFSNFQKHRAWAVWLQTNILVIFSLLYYVRLNSRDFALFGVTLTTSQIFIPISVLIFLVNQNLFGKHKNKIYLLAPQVLLFALNIFSLLSFIAIDRTNLRNFSQDWLIQVFSAPDWLWLLLLTLAVSAISVLNLNMEKRQRVILFTSVMTLMLFPIFQIINKFSILYSYKTVLALIIWDLVYLPLRLSALKIPDPRFRFKLVLSTSYHLALILIILYYAII